jgi:hypothetical protein
MTTTLDQQDRVLELRKNGMSLRAIAREMKLGKTAVSNVIDRASGKCTRSPRTTNTLEEAYRRIDASVPNERGCFICPGPSPDGYRSITMYKKTFLLHRLALERKLGRPIRPGLLALHQCDCKPCVNPDHLYEGTPSNNTRDIFERNLGYRDHFYNRLHKHNKSPENLARLQKHRGKHNKSPENLAHLRAWARSPENRAQLRERNKSGRRCPPPENLSL